MSVVHVMENWLKKLGAGAVGGVLLIIATAIALVWSNSDAGGSYQALRDLPLAFGIGAWSLSKPLILWVNDALMAVFFLLVGLEIKRELLDGALSSPRDAALPLAAAVGGMLVPALVFLAFNGGTPASSGWAIPAATDIAFALGILALLGSRVPLALKVFLTAVAVVDDLGAVMIIALFYTSELAVPALLAGAGALAALFVLNRLRVINPLPYIVLGVVLWFCVLKSGVHATVAGVLLALAIPARGMVSPSDFELFGRRVFALDEMEDDDSFAPHTRAHEMRELCNQIEPMLLRWEHGLQPVVLFAIMPIFALFNAGVLLEGGLTHMQSSVALGVGLGLAVGKPVGVMLFAWLAVRAGIASLPESLNWKHVHGAAWLAGIGFTMSLFVTSLAFESAAFAQQAKFGLLAGSFVAAVVGTILLLQASRPNPR